MNDYIIKTPQQLGSVLRGYRKQRVLTQKEVAAKTALPQYKISQIEADPGRSTLSRIFRVLMVLDLELVVRQKQPTKPSSNW
jgi:HTH-type transcriptional regulator/antitoxin HipB